MLRASILAILVVALCGVQADDAITYKECAAEYNFDGPLARTNIIKHNNHTISLDSETEVQDNHVSIETFTLEISDLRAQKEEPKNILVLPKDPSVTWNTLAAVPDDGFIPIGIEFCCQESTKRLFVVKFREDIKDESILDVFITGTSGTN